MPSSAYHRVGNLATHPAWNRRQAAMVCPLCGTAHLRVSDYDRDFLGHDPSAEDAREWLSWRTYRREARRRGWPLDEPEEGVP